MQFFRRKSGPKRDIAVELHDERTTSLASAAKLARQQPEMFGLPFVEIQVATALSQFRDPPISAEAIGEICSSSVSQASEVDADPLVRAWVEAASKSASLTLLRLLAEREPPLGTGTISQSGARRAIGVIAAFFTQFYLDAKGLVPSESSRAAVRAIDPFGKSFFDWRMNESTKPQPPGWGMEDVDGSALLPAIYIALRVPDVGAIPVDCSPISSLIPDGLRPPALNDFGGSFSTYSTVTTMMAVDFAPRLEWLINKGSS